MTFDQDRDLERAVGRVEAKVDMLVAALSDYREKVDTIAAQVHGYSGYKEKVDKLHGHMYMVKGGIGLISVLLVVLNVLKLLKYV